MGKPNDNATDKPMPAATWAPEPPSLDLDPQPLPDQAQKTEAESAKTPPARSGQSARPEKVTEGSGPDNPVHHTGRMPAKGLPDDT